MMTDSPPATIAGRRWPVEETFKTGMDVLRWDQCQARTFDAICRHTVLAALAQLRAAAIRGALCGAAQYTAGLITRARLAFALRWSARRRRHQAAARWHHYSARLLSTAATG
jgi:Transposase DDE domain